MSAEESTPGQEPAQEARFVAICCSNCGAAFRAREWRAEVKCLSCGARALQPMAAPGGAVDYILADRSHGTTAHDVAFAQWAKWCGLITANQYNAAIHRQNSELKERGKARPIHEVMQDMGMLDQDAALGLLRFLALPRPDDNDTSFTARLILRGKVDEHQVRALAAAHKQMASERNEVPPIGQFLLQKQVITEAEMLDILQEQAREGEGSLAQAQEMVRPQKEEPAKGRLEERILSHRRTLFGLAVFFLLLLIAGLVWAKQGRRQNVQAWGLCRNCQVMVKVPWTAAGWPARCPRCGKEAVDFAVRCPNGHIFVRASPFSHERCPVCNADYGRPLTDDDVRRPAPARRR